MLVTVTDAEDDIDLTVVAESDAAGIDKDTVRCDLRVDRTD
jgi:hypothetical protein